MSSHAVCTRPSCEKDARMWERSKDAILVGYLDSNKYSLLTALEICYIDSERQLIPARLGVLHSPRRGIRSVTEITRSVPRSPKCLDDKHLPRIHARDQD